MLAKKYFGVIEFLVLGILLVSGGLLFFCFIEKNESCFAYLVTVETLLCSGLIFSVILSSHKLNTQNKLLFPAVLFSGLVIRLSMAAMYFGNFDMGCWVKTNAISARGENIYDVTWIYMYSPIILWTLNILEIARNAISSSIPEQLPIKFFLTLVDLGIVFVLRPLGKLRGIQPLAITIFFFLNPVSFLLTGYHGQFENMASFLTLLGFLLVSQNIQKPKYLAGWVLCFVGTLVKHNIFYTPAVAFSCFLKKRSHQLIAVILGGFIIWAIFVPFGGIFVNPNITKYFLHYNPPKEDWGFAAYYFDWGPRFKGLLLAIMAVYIFLIRKRPFDTQMLGCALLFLFIATGVGIQYFVIPIFYGVLFPSVFFGLYTFITAVHILGSGNNMDISFFAPVYANFIWSSVVLWFLYHEGLFSKLLGHGHLQFLNPSRNLKK